ncbi:hypothetical protein [Limimaricola soesokkakensis]|uniref:hypothetical protein n=1 Tax=Limimaricola soesokkakensis TaxID=1343159 RepID=UPI0035114642
MLQTHLGTSMPTGGGYSIIAVMNAQRPNGPPTSNEHPAGDELPQNWHEGGSSGGTNLGIGSGISDSS